MRVAGDEDYYDEGAYEPDDDASPSSASSPKKKRDAASTAVRFKAMQQARSRRSDTTPVRRAVSRAASGERRSSPSLKAAGLGAVAAAQPPASQAL